MRTRVWIAVVLALVLMPASFARADFAQSERWFITLPDDDRFLLQANLVLLGLYDKFVDGEFGNGTYGALTKFQAAVGVSPTGVLSQSLLDELDRQANLVFARLGLSFAEDQRADVALPVPNILLPYKTDVEGGTRYRNADQSIELQTIRKPAASVSFADLYQRLKSPNAVREVTYSAFSPQRFVVSGSDRGRRFYLLFQNSTEGSRGFSLTWLPVANSDASVIAMFIASYLMPLELYRTEVTTSTTEPAKKVAPESPQPIDTATTSPNLAGAGLERMGSMAIVDGAPNVIMLAGDITSATPLEFLRALKARPEARVLLLDSDGGLVDPGLVLAHEVHERGLSTVVPVGADCLSACSFVYFAGKERTVVGNLGVHQVWNEANDLVSGQAKLSDVLEALADFDVDQGVISVMLRTPPQEMHVFSPREIAAFKINVGEVPSALAAEAIQPTPAGTGTAPTSPARAPSLPHGQFAPSLASALQAALDGYQVALNTAATGDLLSAQTNGRNAEARIRALCMSNGYSDIRSCIGSDLPPIEASAESSGGEEGVGGYVQLGSKATAIDAQRAVPMTTTKVRKVLPEAVIAIKEVNFGENGSWYRLVVEFTTFPAAVNACEQLKTAGINCVTIRAPQG